MTWHGHKPGTPLSDKIGSALIIPFIFAALLGLLMLIKWIIAKLTGSTFQQPIGPHEYEITDFVLRETNELGSIETKLDRIKMIKETKDHIFVILSNGLGHIIPKRERATEELDAILKLLKRPANKPSTAAA